jgi:hypothetical protein
MLRPIAWTIGGLAIVVVAVVLAHAPETGFVDPPPARRGTSSADPIDARVNDPQRNAIESDVDEKSAASPSRTMTLRGRVVDEQGHGIEGARVMAFQTFDRPPLAPIELDRPFGTVSVARRTVNGVADTYWHFIGPLPPESRSGSEPMTRTSTDGSFRLEVPETTRLYPFADRFSLANAIAVNAPGRAPRRSVFGRIGSVNRSIRAITSSNAEWRSEVRSSTRVGWPSPMPSCSSGASRSATSGQVRSRVAS